MVSTLAAGTAGSRGRRAADEFRSVNAQIEAVVVEAARRARRLPRARSRTSTDDAE